jgi:hypothetical protein
MTALRTHYLTHGRARCGNPLGRNWTVAPSKVTCKSCKKLMAGEVE